MLNVRCIFRIFFFHDYKFSLLLFDAFSLYLSLSSMFSFSVCPADFRKRAIGLLISRFPKSWMLQSYDYTVEGKHPIWLILLMKTEIFVWGSSQLRINSFESVILLDTKHDIKFLHLLLIIEDRWRQTTKSTEKQHSNNELLVSEQKSYQFKSTQCG